MRTETGEMQLPAKVGPQSSEEARRTPPRASEHSPADTWVGRLAPRTVRQEFPLL